MQPNDLMALLSGLEPVRLQAVELCQRHQVGDGGVDFGSMPRDEVVVAVREIAEYGDRCSAVAEKLVNGLKPNALKIIVHEFGL